MVEDDAELHVVLYTPPSHFDVSVILRTLYTGLGPTASWKVHVIGMGKRLPLKTALDSRVPIEVFLSKVDTSEPAYNDACVAIVDPSRGKPVWSVERRRFTHVVVDYSASSSYAGKAACIENVRALGLSSKTYEAVAVLYELAIRPRASSKPSCTPQHVDARRAVYLARKFAEAISFLDNYLVLEPNTVAYVLRRVYLAEGIIVDPSNYSVNIDVGLGRVHEEIVLKAYNKRFKPLGSVVVRTSSDCVEVIDWRGVRFRFILDRLRRRVCISSATCFKHREWESNTHTPIFETIS